MTTRKCKTHNEPLEIESDCDGEYVQRYCPVCWGEKVKCRECGEYTYAPVYYDDDLPLCQECYDDARKEDEKWNGSASK